MSLYPQVYGLSFEQQTRQTVADLERRLMALESTAGRIGTGSIGGAGGAGQIAPGSISSPDIEANSIDASLIHVTSLSAISANLGNVTAGSLTVGGDPAVNYVRAGGPLPVNPQIQLDSTGLWAQKADGTEQFRMDAVLGVFTAQGIFTMQAGSAVPWGAQGFQIGAGNLANDASFEGDPPGTTALTAWQSSGASANVIDYSSTATPAFHLKQLVGLTCTTAGSVELYQRDTPDMTYLTVARGATDRWSVSGYVRTPTGGAVRSAQAYLRYYDASGTFLGKTACGPAVNTIPGQFIRVAGTATPPSNAVYVGGSVVVGTMAVSETVEIDAVQLEMGDVPTSFNQVTARYLSALSADLGQIRAGTVTGATFQTNYANPKLILDNTGLSSISSGGSTLFSLSPGGSFTATGGTITGALFRTAASGSRIEVGSGNNLNVYNSAGSRVAQLGGGLSPVISEQNLASSNIVVPVSSTQSNMWQSGNITVLSGQTIIVLLGGTVFNVFAQSFYVYLRAVYGLTAGEEQATSLYSADFQSLTAVTTWTNTGSDTTTVVTCQCRSENREGTNVNVVFMQNTGWYIALRM